MTNNENSVLEKIVKKKLTVDDILSSILLIVAELLASFVILSYRSFEKIWPFIVGGFIFVTWLFMTQKKIEFEYSYFDAELTIDKIVNKHRRKRLGFFYIKDVEVFGRAIHSKRYENNTSIEVYASSINAPELYFFVIKDKAKKKLIYFEPSEEMIRLISLKIPRQVLGE